MKKTIYLFLAFITAVILIVNDDYERFVGDVDTLECKTITTQLKLPIKTPIRMTSGKLCISPRDDDQKVFGIQVSSRIDAATFSRRWIEKLNTTNEVITRYFTSIHTMEPLDYLFIYIEKTIQFIQKDNTQTLATVLCPECGDIITNGLLGYFDKI
jgi:hypothetical protein